MTKEIRKEREREEMRKIILDAAGQIIAEEGIERLSIRKISQKMEYSAGIIYHYFQNKNDIIEHLLQKGYQDMVSGIRSAQGEEMGGDPSLILKQSLQQFITMALEEGSQYPNVMLNDSPAVLSHTSVLFRGAAQERKAIDMLCHCLGQFQHIKEKDQVYIELTAQVIWSAAFGLIIRLTVEKELPVEQREALISHYLDTMLVIANQS
ncbi:TetR/AcrR family transcriptional regulator [Paenibacillus wynnii]|uniref:TetR/AcrR family transcriptional regulator n=1 Tax=Paenibacillus wynnii TaxID=268407 RepID=UPI002792C8FC|nr:TetR/AcrR family transcriptional regulator [Paenibacillus wynnii]MDQ0194263.1 AcrR family transcriptional regulator [Paenibacillus wynnii]